MLLKIWNNFFKYDPEADKFNSYAPSTMPYSIGTWFKCNDEEILRLRKAVLAGEAEIVHSIPKIEHGY